MDNPKKTVVRSEKYLKAVRKLPCSISGCNTQPIHAAHIRKGTDGGMGLKPSDTWAIPLCYQHHHEQHQIGEMPFEERHGIDMKAIARRLQNEISV